MSANEPQLKKRIEIPREFGPQQRESLGNKIIEFIQKRTDKGLDIEGKAFAPYSAAYIASDDFKLAGKSKDQVNLKLTKDMMSSIELLNHGSGYITIGFQEGTEANNKGVWNQRSDNGPSRKFLGIKENDLEKLIAEVNIETPGIDDLATSLASKAASAILKKLGF